MPRPGLRVAVVGGGPGGLYFAALLKQLDPRHEVEVWERNAPDDTFGFGVVFSDETLGGIEHADPVILTEMERRFARWDDIDVHYRGEVVTSGGHGFAAMGRRDLLQVLQRRAHELGVQIRFRREAPPLEELEDRDLVVAADGVNSRVRDDHPHLFGPSLEVGRCRYMWLGTDLVFDAFKFFVLETPYGVFQVHAYPYGERMSTFIVEAAEEPWRRAGFEVPARRRYPPGESDLESIARLEELFAGVLHGHRLVANNSKWLTFVTVRNRRWRHRNVVLLGDAAHTAHFSIGSGTKLAMEDALALAACLHEHREVEVALEAYEVERRPVVESAQRAAAASRQWFEQIGQYVGQDPLQFAFNLLTRSRRVTHQNLRVRDPQFAAEVERWFVEAERRRGVVGRTPPCPPMFVPIRLRGLELANRVVVSAMDMYSSEDGLIGDFHLVHLGSKALGGPGLVMTEMVCVSPEGRITPGCAGLWREDHEAAFARLVEFVHRYSPAAIGIQLGHSGRKGSTRLMWEGMDEPLAEGNWPLLAPSPIPYLSGRSQVPREMDREDMDMVLAQFVQAARRAARAGFDLLELHCAHGYLLASFISPLTNRRRDRYGGSLENRLRYPLEVFDAVRAVWPAEKPMAVRISACDWCEGGTTLDEAVAVARAFAEHGADAIDVSTGQTVPDERPDFGRTYQVPFADAIRNRAGITTIAVGAISSYDDVNSILLAGRADLCAIARAHLYDPHWTLHAAADQGHPLAWPVQFERGSRPPPQSRGDRVPPRLELVRRPPVGPAHARWRPARGEAVS
jgi:anthraniloyl-CoA monooxygenase